MSDYKSVYVSSSYYFHTFKGRLINSDNQYFYLCDHLLYDWLVFLNHQDWLDEIKLSSFDKKLFKYNEVNTIDVNHSFVFDFPVSEKDVNLLHTISDCFSFYLEMNEKTFCERIEKMVGIYDSRLPKDKLKEIINFLIVKEKKENERIRLILSDKVGSLLNYKE